MKNAAIVLISGDNLDRILLLRDKSSGKWMIPGGKIDRTDKTPFAAAKREFKEETTFDLPPLGNLGKHNYNNHTMIYVGYYKGRFGKFTNTNETDKIRYVKIQSILDGTFEKKHGPIKYYVKNSLRQMLSH